MNVDSFITRHFKDMQDVCNAYIKDAHLSGDLLQESAILLLKKREDPKLISLLSKGQGMYYYVGMIKSMVTRKNCKFYYTFINRRPIVYNRLERASEQDIDERLNEVDRIVSKLRWYKQELWKLYFDEKYSFTKLANETGIPRNELYLDITQLKKEVKRIYNESSSLD